MTTELPIIMTAAGARPTPPADIRTALLNNVSAVNPGYTANLPGSLIEDISSTDVAAIALIDAARVETINSLTPFGANAFLLTQLGTIYGVPIAEATRTSVYVQFDGTPGFVVPQGFTVSDGTYQYALQDGGIIGEDGLSNLLFAVATQDGSWAIPAGTVQQLITSVPTGVTLTVNNPSTGTAGAGQQSESEYRAIVLQAGLAASQGMATYLKTLLAKISGVQARLVSVRQVDGGGWEVIVGGGDPYQVADAIFRALFDVSTLTGSVIAVTNITKANPGVVTTDLNHGLTTGGSVTIAESNPTNYNGTYTATVLTDKTFSIGVNTTGFPTYVGDGIVTPNTRNISVTINDYPDTYTIPFVNPPQQTVAIALTWNTTSTNLVSPASVAQLGSDALVEYINNIPVGLPINQFEMQSVFMAAVSSLIPPQLLTRMVFSVSINNVGVAPSAGTGIIAGDPESYFLTDAGSVTITQG